MNEKDYENNNITTDDGEKIQKEDCSSCFVDGVKMVEVDFNSQQNFFEDTSQKTQDDEELERIKREQMEIFKYKKERSFSRTPLCLSLVALICSVFFGLGIFISIPALIISIIRLKRKSSKALKWAVIISIVTTFVCVLILFSLGYGIIVGLIKYAEQMEQTQEIISWFLG